MPKAARYRLSWSDEHQTYELFETIAGRPLRITPGEPEWFTWLESISSFTFSGKLGEFTARKESRQWGDCYWYAYRRVGSKLSKKYLGRTTDVILTRLEEIAALIAASGAYQPKEALTQAPSKKVISVQRSRRATIKEAPARNGDTSSTLSTKPGIQRDLLLLTKLHRPRPHSRLVSRPHLVDRLQQGMERTLTLISAPAGFGKTTLLAQWIEESKMPVSWLSLEPEDNDPVRFLTYLVVALQMQDPQLGVSVLELLKAAPSTPLERALAALTNDLLHQHAGDFALILDDYQVITDQSIHRALSFLLEHLPQQMHLVLSSRTDPPLSLARLRARGQLTEVRVAELRLSVDEAEVFLQEVMGLELSPDAVAALEHRTEGWVAGLQLAALSLEDKADVPAFLAGFSGSHRFILDYLSEEVLSRQPAPLQSFLLYTSILDRLTGSLCDTVTDQQGSREVLEVLERANLFLVSLDDERRWYRYHRLFADVLLSHLQHSQPAIVPELHRRASYWYRERGLIVEAVHHMLAAPDYERAAELIEEHAQTIAMAGQIQLVLGWLKKLPDSLVRTRPILCINYADLLFHTQQLEAAESRLQDTERCLTPQMLPKQARTIRGCVADIRALIARQYGDLSLYIALAQQSLDLLPESEELWRASAEMHAAHAYLLSGDVTPASEHMVRNAIVHSLTSGDVFQILAAGRLLGRMQILHGHLKEASVTYEKAIQAVQNQEALLILRGASVYSFGMGELLREWNRLDDAEEILTDGMEFLARGMQVPADEVTQGYMTLARLKQARGEYGKGLATLEAFKQLARQHYYVPHILDQVAAFQAQIELAQGNLAAAVDWLEKSGLSTGNAEVPYLRERGYLTLARVRIAQGRSDSATPLLGETLSLLEQLQKSAESKARMGSVLEILVLQALALDAQGKRAEALAVLERALKLAAPEEYIRLFVDEGKPMRLLLRDAQARGIIPEYVATLLTAFGEPTATRLPAKPGSLIDPLTEREREVLALLLEGGSNREIARRLVLSINTVKRHIYNICGKLGVQSRTQAIVKARKLNLL
jgi:LuxR family maltose regulon positive regulatory protein